mgnify:CR=1 FL=1
MSGPTGPAGATYAAAGVDIEDEQALGAFIEGWNARNELDLGDLEVPQAIEPDELLQLKITLKAISKPPVWRRVQVRADSTFAMLHQIIQAAFGWTDTHLHRFEYEGERIGVPDPEWDDDCADAAETTLDQVLLGPKDRLRYTYDFGDNWEHTLTI